AVRQRRVDVAARAALGLEDLLELTVGTEALGHAHRLALRVLPDLGAPELGRVRLVAEADGDLIALEGDLDARVHRRAFAQAGAGDAAGHEVELVGRLLDRLGHDLLGLLARLIEAPGPLEALLGLLGPTVARVVGSARFGAARFAAARAGGTVGDGRGRRRDEREARRDEGAEEEGLAVLHI